MLIIISKDNVDILNRELEEFKELYESSFPEVNEREEFEDILDRIRRGHEPSSYISLYIINARVIGGAVYDWYDSCKCLELIYLTVASEYRHGGIGREIINETLNRLRNKCKIFPELLFAEVENPKLVTGADSIMNADDRLIVYQHLGFKLIPIHYVQPPLSNSKENVTNLLLICKNQYNDNISSELLILFLESFYKGLNVDNSIYLENMKNEIKTLSVCGKIHPVDLHM